MKYKTSEYAIYSQPNDGGWIRVQVVGETPAGLAKGRDAYKAEFMMHSAMVERGTETSLTCIIRRRESC